MLFVDARPHEIDDCDVVPWLNPSAETVAEHGAQRGFEHRFVGLLNATFSVEGEDLMGRSELLLGACHEAVDLRPVNRMWLEFLHAAPTSETRLLRQTFSRKESLRSRRDSSSFACEKRIVDFASELPFEFLHYLRQRVTFQLADHENINVASGVLLVSRERAIQIGFFYSVDLLERFNRTDGLRDDAELIPSVLSITANY